MHHFIPHFIGLGGLLGLALAIWIFNDAEVHGQDGVVWAIMAFFFTIPALIIYFLFFRQGIAPALKHKATDRNSDFILRGQYTTRPGQSTVYGNGKGIAPSHAQGVEPVFSDPELDRLIRQGELSKAREYLDDMVKVAHDVGDSATVRNYEHYRARISEGATKPRRTHHSDI